MKAGDLADTTPVAFYGVLSRTVASSSLDRVAEEIRLLGYSVLDGGYTRDELVALSDAFDAALGGYRDTHGLEALRSMDEHNTVRLLLAHEPVFLALALNEVLIAAVSKLIAGKFILNQQNGIVNPSKENYNQGAWHRDLPYQHFVSSTPLAINALFCVDDFTRENGATFVLPASHHAGAFPSEGFVQSNALQIEAKAGQFILLDCMLFHTGGHNSSSRDRRAVNHVFSIPYFKQQIAIAGNVDESRLSAQALSILGFDHREPASVSQYFAGRRR